MKNSQKTISLLVLILSAITLVLVILSFLHIVNNDITMLFLGFTQVFGGINQINMSKQTNLKGVSKGNKGLGVFCITLGIIIIIYGVKRMIV